MLKTGLALVLLGVGATLTAPLAHADTAGFIDYLSDNGVPVATSTLRQSHLQVGQAICVLYDAHVGAGDSKSVANDDALTTMEGRGDHTTQEAAMWVVGAVNYLCPQYKWMM
jgi:hypothetical protein